MTVLTVDGRPCTVFGMETTEAVVHPGAKFEVDYSNEVAITVHAVGCAHRPQRGRSRSPLKSTDLKTALIEAQHQGDLEPSDSMDLGYTKAAPCAKRIA